MKILLVEDSALVLKYKIQILRSAGHTVRATRHGDEAAKHYDERHYDLVLTDLWHPGLEAHNLIKRIFEKNPRQVVGVISSTTVMEEKSVCPSCRHRANRTNSSLSFVISPVLQSSASKHSS